MTSKHEHALDGGAGETFGPYIVYERLGVGGMATVHRAVERGIEGFERVVALKRLLPHLAEDEDFVRSFVREAKLASQLQHINICQLYELGRVGSVYFISMEQIDGRDVRQLLRQARRVAGPPPIQVVVSILADVCDALDYAHNCTDDTGERLGLVHRDVSPSNLLVASSGHVKVIDFGIAKATSHKLKTQTGRVKGKLAYMAPEAIRGAPLDARSDVFSTGVIAHELLTATPLFASKNDYETLTRIQHAEVTPPSHKNSECPEDLDAIVLRALAKDPDERFASAGEFRDALDALRVDRQLNATNRAVKSWISEAFADGAATRASRAASVPGSFSRNDRSPSGPGSDSGGRGLASPIVASSLQESLALAAEGNAAGGDDAAPARGGDESRADGDAGEDLGERARSAGAAGGADAAGAAPDDEEARGARGHADTPRRAPGSAERDDEPDASGAAASADEDDDRANGDEEVVDLAWGDDAGAPVILDEVPDLSDRFPVPKPPELPAAAMVPAGPGGAGQRVAAAGEANAEIDVHDDDATAMVALRDADGGDAPAPEPARPKIWPTGTNPPSTRQQQPAARRSTAIGATIVAREPTLLKRLALGGVVVAAAAAGAALLVRGDGRPAQNENAAAVAADSAAEAAGAERATVKFLVEPEGAEDAAIHGEIMIDGEVAYAGELPHALRVEPGTHRAEIRSEGYKSWVVALEIGAGDTQLVRAPLERGGTDRAVLSVRSTPPGLRVRVNGDTLPQRTPLTVDVDPGPHSIAVLGADGARWTDEFEAEASTKYSFHPVLAAGGGGGARLAAADEDSDRGGSRDRAPAPKPASEPDRKVPQLSQAAITPTASALSPLPVEVKDPPARERRGAAPSAGSSAAPEPVVVPPSAMTKIRGDVPRVHIRSGSAARKRVSAKICVDARGHVSEVRILSDVLYEVERRLKLGLKQWRYKPHRKGGERTPACFALNFRLRTR